MELIFLWLEMENPMENDDDGVNGSKEKEEKKKTNKKDQDYRKV